MDVDVDAGPPDINIVTLNCWGLKFNISKLRKPRLQEIGRQLRLLSPRPDAVCLQEVWSHADYVAIHRETRPFLPYAKHYFSGAFGAGLAILSRWPIEESSMTPYTLNGRPTAFWRGDWYVGKGIAHARLRYAAGPRDVLEVFNTHTHASYHSDTGDSYHLHRDAQAWQLAKLLRGAAERGHLVVAAGDFNMTPLSSAYFIITAHAPVRDVWRVLHPESSRGGAGDDIPTAHFNVLNNGVTSNSIFNTWRWPRRLQKKLGPGGLVIDIDPETPDPRGKRLDYIFAGTALRELHNRSMAGWVVKDARVGMMARHPDLGCSLSDHFSVEATLTFHTTARVGASTAHSLKGPSLPPSGRARSLSASGRLPPPPTRLRQPSPAHQTETGLDQDGDDSNNHNGTPAGGAFLELCTPTPSTSRNSSTHRVDSNDMEKKKKKKKKKKNNNNNNMHNTNTNRNTTTTSSSSLIHWPLPLASNHDGQLLSSPPPYPVISPCPSDYDAILSRLSSYRAREAAQTRYRSLHCGLWVMVAVACHVGVWFVPAGDREGASNSNSNSNSNARVHAINFVLLLVSSLGLAAGLVDGLLAVLFFGGSEKRALAELEWEVSSARARALARAAGESARDAGHAAVAVVAVAGAGAGAGAGHDHDHDRPPPSSVLGGRSWTLNTAKEPVISDDEMR